MAACARRLASRLAAHFTLPGDTEEAVMQKVVLFLCTVFSALSNVSVALTFQNAFPKVVCGSVGAVMGASLVALYRRKTYSISYLSVQLGFTLVSIAGMDLYLAAQGGVRMWPMFVLVVDMLLVIDAPQGQLHGVVAFTLTYLLCLEVERATRALQLFDIPGMVPYEDREWTGCARPPCPHGRADIASLAWGSQALVFGVDLLLTRGFARKMRAERAEVAAATEATEHIASSLASFDLGAVEKFLEEDEQARNLSTALCSAFFTLLGNLRSYKVFLPGEFFSENNARIEVSAPGTPLRGLPGISTKPTAVPTAAIVFTDIRASTSLWEFSSAAMHDALRAHNDLVRFSLDEACGYEVKTVGDSFMIAFATAVDAVQFGAAVQCGLRATAWPEGLRRAHMDDGFPVLSTRIGVHFGPVTAERNVLTKRYDYFGPTVNKASRVEAFGIPGVVTVTQDVLDEIDAAPTRRRSRRVRKDSLDEVGFLDQNRRRSSSPCVGDNSVAPFVDHEPPVPCTRIRYAHPRVGKGLVEPLFLVALVPAPLQEELDALVRSECGRNPVLPTDEKKHLSAGRLRRPSGGPAAAAPPGPVAAAEAGSDTAATVSIVKYCTDPVVADARPGAALSARLEELVQVLDQTGGHLSVVLNDLCVVSWNVVRPCRQHVNQSARFLMRLQSVVQGDDDADGESARYHAGLAVGPVSTVEVSASGSQRFVTLAGIPVDVALMLCVSAAELDVTALVAATGAERRRFTHNAALHAFVHPIDKWTIDAEVVQVCALDIPALATTDLHQRRASADDTSVCWGRSIAQNPRLPHALARVRSAAEQVSSDASYGYGSSTSSLLCHFSPT
eukprot:TRINITY_DN2386_c0_g10_i1.p1 TRINITY_DN2386_c0_g10~~TRINITY_DN2386_c0_g10_i1.p1  ORF type:complete len:867 (+),score=249.44 TRINITY_DN2386_c0_g10_i1:70-2601(+)